MTTLSPRQQRLTVNVEQAARLLGVSKNHAYSCIDKGTFPCRVVRIGTRYVVPCADLAATLGVDELPLDGKEVPARSAQGAQQQ